MPKLAASAPCDDDHFYPQPEAGRTDIGGRIFFHGTTRRSARKILKQGFRDWSWTEETPLLKYKAKQGIVRWMHGGFYGRGTYVTCNWRAALYFGPVLFRVELQPGTRILRLDVPPDGKVLDTLRREFGCEILKSPPWKVMPRNKRLTLDEAIQLARHHARAFQSTWLSCTGECRHETLMRDLRKILVRYGIQGWGEPAYLGGIVIFATDRIKVSEVVLSLPTARLWYQCNLLDRREGCFATLDAMAQAMRSARNRGADNTRKWVDQANQELQGRIHS